MPMKKYLLTLVYVLFAATPSFGGATFTFTDQWTTGGQGNFQIESCLSHVAFFKVLSGDSGRCRIGLDRIQKVLDGSLQKCGSHSRKSGGSPAFSSTSSASLGPQQSTSRELCPCHRALHHWHQCRAMSRRILQGLGHSGLAQSLWQQCRPS